MLKNRIVACLAIKGGIVVQSIGFERYLPVGDPRITVEFLNRWGIDEIILLDIDATPRGREPDFEMVREISKRCIIPLTVGGGISRMEEIGLLLHAGADKIAINKTAILNPSFIKQAAGVFGTQCVVVSIDAMLNDKGLYEVYADSGKVPTGLDPVQLARQAEALGAGELLITSIVRDGSKKGYDLDLIRLITASVDVPVIACGGVGHASHFMEGLKKAGASAAAAGNYFHFTEHSPITTKAYLLGHGLEIRLDTHANYREIQFNSGSGRVAKRPEAFLEKLRFEYQHDEVI